MAVNFVGTTPGQRLVNLTIAPVTATPTSLGIVWKNTLSWQGTTFALNSNTQSTLNEIGLRHGSGPSFLGAYCAATSGTEALTTLAVPADAWASLLGAFSSSTLRNAYINGGNVGSNTTSRSPAALQQVSIGSHYLDNTNVWLNHAYGNGADAAVWGSALTVEEVAACGALFCPVLVFPMSLKSYWPLGGAYGNQYQDRVGDTHLTPVNSPTWTDDHPKTIYPCECMCC